MATVTTSVTELPESRVRVEAEVSAEEVERRLQDTARHLGRQMKLPGFRKGKVPPPMVLRRVGRATVLDETVRDSLPAWYVEAVESAGIAPIGDPELKLPGLPQEGEALRFSIEVGVRPQAELGDYRGLEVGRREPDVPADAIERELDRLRDRLARLEAVDGAAQDRDFMVIDFSGTVDGEPVAGGEARDELVELGSGRLPDELDRGLVGAAAGDSREIDVAFPEDHPNAALAGKAGRFAVTVKEVKRKQLPSLDDDFAVDAAGFDSLEELREDIRAKLEEAERAAIDAEFREAAVDAAVAEARVEVPEPLVDARARELWEQLSTALERQGISREAYLRISGKSEDEILAEARPDAERALRREAVLAAVVEAEGIEPSEQDLTAALERSAEQEQTTAAELLQSLRATGRAEPLRREIATRQAVDLIAGEAKPISVEQAKARDKLWTPGKPEPEPSPAGASKPRAGELWTPGS